MKGLTAVAVFFVVAVALFLRVGDLASRPLHNDEAINATKLARLWNTGEYRYNPEEYHGPVLYYVALPVTRVVEWFRGATEQGPGEASMRWTAILAGMALMGVTVWMVDGLGWRGWWISGLWLAVSPAFVYYSRYFIHELWLVLFSGLALSAGWRFYQSPGRVWAAVFGASLGLMYATKETFVFNVAAAGVALGVLVLREARGRGARGLRVLGESVRAICGRVSGGNMAWAVGAAVGVWALLFSSFFSNAQGLLDSVRTYWIWLERAGGASPHIHPWWFYAERLGWFHERGGPRWTEAGVLGLALLGGILAFQTPRKGNSPDPGRDGRDSGTDLGGSNGTLVRFLAIYSLVLAGIYSALPYKTPWCALGFYHGGILLAGWVVSELLTRVRSWQGRAVMLTLVGLASVHLARQAWRATREYAADFRNPYVYAHTSADIFNLLEQMREVSGSAPEGKEVRVNVMVPDSGYWPMPWYLRDFPKVGWWDRIPAEPYAPIMVVASRLKAGFEEKTNQGWLMVGLFELRPRTFVELYVEAKLWERFLAARKAAREAGGEG